MNERNALAAGLSVGIAVGLVALIGPWILLALGILMILVGIVLCLTVIGIVVGVPLIVIGILAVVGGAIGGHLGPVFALLLGLGAGVFVYERRTRRLVSH